LPEVINDYVDPENPMRFIDAFVDGLDLAAAGFARVMPEKTGRPGYAPGVPTKAMARMRSGISPKRMASRPSLPANPAAKRKSVMTRKLTRSAMSSNAAFAGSKIGVASLQGTTSSHRISCPRFASSPPWLIGSDLIESGP